MTPSQVSHISQGAYIASEYSSRAEHLNSEPQCVFRGYLPWASEGLHHCPTYMGLGRVLCAPLKSPWLKSGYEEPLGQLQMYQHLHHGGA